MKYFSFLLFLLFFAQASQAQTCPSGLLHFQSQVEVDSFPIKYPGCTSLPEGLLIGIYPSNNDVNNLDALSQVTSIGEFKIFNSAMTNCTLPNLTTVEKLYFYGNDNLTSLSGLSNLTTITGDLDIDYNLNMQGLALSQLSTIGGDATIKNNTNISSIAMPQLQTIDKYLLIANNMNLGNLDLPQLISTGGIAIYSNLPSLAVNLPKLETTGGLSLGQIQTLSLPKLHTATGIAIEETSLTDLSGLSNLNMVVGDLRIRNNTNLVNCSGLSSLNKIGGDFYIYNNSKLKNFSGLTSLDSILGFLSVYKSSQLENFIGLENLKSADGIQIGESYGENPLLSSLKGLSGLNSSGNLYIRGNPILNNLNELTSLNSATAIVLWGNEQLEDISALASLTGSELTYVTIKNNTNLEICNIEPICDFLQIPDADKNIANNKTGCNTYQEIILACDPSTSLLVSCPDPINIAIPFGASDVAVNWNEPMAATNCSTNSNVNLTSNITSGTALGIGSYTVTYQATDACANSETCSFGIIVGSSPSEFEINILNCPTTYPNSGEDYILDFTVKNTGGLPSDETNLQLVQTYSQAGNQEYSGVGSVTIPSIVPGETYSTIHNFGAVGSYPSDFTIASWSATYTNTYTLRTYNGPGQPMYEGFVDLYCKKFNSELEVSVDADSYLIDADGNLEYDITIANIGNELAANIMTHVGYPLWGKNDFTLSEKPLGAKHYRDKGNKEDLFLHLPLLAAGASESFHVAVHIQGDIDSIFDPNVYAYSNHQIDDKIFYASESKFLKNASDLSITNLINLPAGGLAGEVVGFDFDLNNNGNSTAMEEYKVGMYLSTDSIFDSSDVLVGDIVTAQTAVGTVQAVHGAITVPELSPDEYYLIIMADAESSVVEANENNNSLATKFSILNPTGILELSQNAISIQPNPATDLIKISTPNKLDKVLVYNVFGQLVLEETKSEFSISDFPNGVYAAVVYVAGAPVVTHFVVQ